jgi:hypothetical protein
LLGYTGAIAVVIGSMIISLGSDAKN